MCCVHGSRRWLHVIGFENAMNVDKDGTFPTNVKCVIKARGKAVQTTACNLLITMREDS